MFRIYLTDLAAYNAGYLVGEWIDLPMDEDELYEKLQEILRKGERVSKDLCGHEEYFITDYENDYGYKVEEYENLIKLNELAERLENSDYNEDLLKAAIWTFNDIGEALDVLDSGRYTEAHGVDSEEDLGYWAADNGYFDRIPEDLRCYIDYEAIGREWTCSGWYIYEDLNIAICWQ